MKLFKIHYSFILISICFILSPYQNFFFKLLLCLLIHEVGHLFFVYLFKIDIFSLRLYALGFLMNIDNKNISFIKNLFIYSGGIIFNLISLLIFKGEFKNITFILIFLNLLPIYPLDGYMIFKTILSYIFPYRISLYSINAISSVLLVVLFFILISKLDYLLFYNLASLLLMNFHELKNINLKYESFILHRYLNPPSYKFRKVNLRYNSYDYLYRYHKIYTKIGNKRIDEEEILKIKYR